MNLEATPLREGRQPATEQTVQVPQSGQSPRQQQDGGCQSPRREENGASSVLGDRISVWGDEKGPGDR